MLSFGRCAKCQLDNLSESLTKCPNCAYPLGRSSLFAHYLQPCPPEQIENQQEDSDKILSASPTTVASIMKHGPIKPPPEIGDYCFLVFECRFENRLGCKIYGNGPVAIEWVDDVRMKMSPGVLVTLQGNYTNVLMNRGLYPSIGDIIVSVGDMNVEHLGAYEVNIL